MNTVGLDLGSAASSAFTRSIADITSSMENHGVVTEASFEVESINHQVLHATLFLNGDSLVGVPSPDDNFVTATMTLGGATATLTGNDAAADVNAINAAFGDQGVSASVDLDAVDTQNGNFYIKLAFSEVAATAANISLISVQGTPAASASFSVSSANITGIAVSDANDGTSGLGTALGGATNAVVVDEVSLNVDGTTPIIEQAA